MLDVEYRKMAVDAAIEGLIQGGWNELEAKCLYLLLERMYNMGYAEAKRDCKQITDWGHY